MQSFRERCGFHGNQQTYQPTSQDSSRLENYRHQSQPGLNCEQRQRQVTKGYYAQASYQGYENSTEEKYPRGNKNMNVQQLQGRASFSSFPEGSGYPAQYSGEDALQNWGQTQALDGAKYEDNLMKKAPGESMGYQEPAGQLPFSSHTLHHPQQPALPYAKIPRQKVQSDVPTSPLSFSQTAHFTQSFPTSSSTYSSVPGGNQVSHSFKSCTAPSNPPHEHSMATASQRVQALHGYQPTRMGSYEQPQPQRHHAQETLHYQNMAKYQHYSQQGQAYCQSETPNRTPEQYYQTFSPSASHSPARSVGRSPSYSSTPSPLMPNLENFQYNQQQHSAGTFPVGISDHSHYMPLLNPSPTGTSSPESHRKSLQKDKIPETLLSDLSLQSLTALTSQVENISNTVQQLLLSKTGISQKKGIKMSPRTPEQMKGQHCSPESSTYSEHLGTPLSEPLGTPQSVHAEMQDADYLSGSEDQLERNYLYCGPGRSPGRASSSKMKPESISTCSVTSPDNMSTKSDDSFQSIHANLPLETFAKLVSSERECPHLLVNALSQEELSSEIIALQDAIENEKAEKAWADSPALDKDSPKSPFHLENHTACVQSVVKSAWSDQGNSEQFPEALKKSVPEKSQLRNRDKCFNDKYYEREEFPSVPTKDMETAGNSLDFSSKNSVRAATSSASYTCYSNTMAHTTCSKSTDPFGWPDKSMAESCLRWKELELSLHPSDLQKDLFQSKEKKINCQLDVPDVETPLENDSGEEFNKEGAEDLTYTEDSKVDNEKWLEDTRDCYNEDEFQDIPDIPSQKESNLEPEDYSSLCDFSDRKSFIYDTSPPKPLGVMEALSSIDTPESAENLNTEEKENSIPSSHLSSHSIILLGPTVGTESKVKSWFESTVSHIKTVEDIQDNSEDNAEVGMLEPATLQEGEKEDLTVQDNLLQSKNEEALKTKPVRSKRIQCRVTEASVPDELYQNSGSDTPVIGNDEKIHAEGENAVILTPVAKVPVEGMPARMCTRSSTAKVAPRTYGTLAGLKAPHQEKLTKRGPFGVKQRGPFKTGRRGGKTALKIMVTPGDQNAFLFQSKSTSSVTSGQKAKENSGKTFKDERSMILRSRSKKQELFQTKRRKEKRGINMGLKNRTSLKKIIANSCAAPDTFKVMAKVGQRMKLTNPGARLNIKAPERTLHSLKRKPSFISPVPAKKRNLILQSKNVKEEKPEASPNLFKKMKSTKKEKVKLTIAAKNACKVILNNAAVRVTPDICMKMASQSPYVGPIKTKVLPPRKGRGLKMEAIVQKITSPSQKKQGGNTAGTSNALAPGNNPLNVPLQEKDLRDDSIAQVDLDTKTLSQDMTQNALPESKAELHYLSCRSSNNRTLKGKPMHGKKGSSKFLHGEVSTHTGAEQDDNCVSAKRGSVVPKKRIRRGRSRGALSTPKNAAKKLLGSSPSVILTSRDKTLSESALLANRHRLGDYKQTELKDGSNLLDGAEAAASQTRARKKAKYPSFNGYTKRQHKAPTRTKSTKQAAGSKRRAKRRSAPPVSPEEPEIKLKYVSSKPVRTESRVRFFSPYVQVEKRNEFTTTCTVINTAGEESRTLKERSSTHVTPPTLCSAADPGTLPFSSRMQLGPLVCKAVTSGCLVCCLCRSPANYKDLGDLCGPYYPVDCLPTKKSRPKDKLQVGENMLDKSEKSPKAAEGLCTPGSGRQPCLDGGATDPTKHNSLRSSTRGVFRKLSSCYCCSKKVEGAEVEKPKRHQCIKTPEPPPAEPTAETQEHWVHEACAVWTSGVYLVAGKLYGVHEAIQMAAARLCPACQRAGASVGCSHKACLQTYHYTCATEAGCLLSEENFSLRCPKHKRHLV